MPDPVRSVEERNALVIQHQGLVWHVWHRLRRRTRVRRLGEEDAVAAGQIGLIRAAERWRPDLAKFSTYAVLWITQAVLREAVDEGVIRVPDHAQRPGAADDQRAACVRAWRVRRLRPATKDDPGLDVPYRDPPRTWDLDGWEDLEDAMRCVHAADREALLLYVAEGLTLDEVGRRMGLAVTREAVRQRVERATMRVRRHLRLKGREVADA